jgi:hypothetical protein
LIYNKRINGTYFVAETVIDAKNKRIVIDSAYKTKKVVGGAGADISTVTLTPETSTDRTTNSTPIIRNSLSNSQANSQKNMKPTAKYDIRFSIKDGKTQLPDTKYKGQSKGQISQYVAEHSKERAFTKAETARRYYFPKQNFENISSSVASVTFVPVIAPM